MSKFQVGDKVRDRYTDAEGTVTVFGDEGVTVEWLDATRRLCIHTFNERRLLLVETAAAAAEGTRIERRVTKDDDEEPERELRITEPAPADGGVTVTVPEEVLDQLDDRVEAERERRREFEGSTAEEDMDTAEEAAAPDSEPADGDPLGRKPDDEL